MKRINALLLSVALVLSGVACKAEPSDDRPATPKKVAKKRIDERRCERYKKGVCKKWDDKDWVLIYSDGSEYDVDEQEYNSVNVGDFWPK